MNSKIQKIMNKKILAIAAMMLLMPMMMGAQALKGSYFLDNSLNRNKLNPAFAPATNYFQIPVIGNFGIGLYSNQKIQSYLYPIDGQLYTYLNKNVSYEQFESALARKPYLDMQVDLNVINFGLKAVGGFWTVDVGLRTNIDSDMPRDLFLFMKKGMGESGTYNIGSVKANVSAAIQAAVGYSRDLSDLVPGLRAGAKVRAILPVAYMGLNLNEARLTATPDKWTVNTDATLHAAVKGLALTDFNGDLNPSMNGVPGIAGFGLSFDLGAEYRLDFDGFIDGVQFSAAFTDLGFVSYGKNSVQMFESNGQMDWTGMKVSLEEGAMDGAMDELKGELDKLMQLDRVGEGSSFTRSSLPSFYVGAEMPFLDEMMSVGMLYSARKSYFNSRHELTLSYNLIPTDWFAFGLNYSFLNVAKTIGWMFEFTPKVGVNFFLGSDYTFLEMARLPKGKGVIPTAYRFNLNFGLAVPLGGNK